MAEDGLVDFYDAMSDMHHAYTIVRREAQEARAERDAAIEKMRRQSTEIDRMRAALERRNRCVEELNEMTKGLKTLVTTLLPCTARSEDCKECPLYDQMVVGHCSIRRELEVLGIDQPTQDVL